MHKGAEFSRLQRVLNFFRKRATDLFQVLSGTQYVKKPILFRKCYVNVSICCFVAVTISVNGPSRPEKVRERIIQISYSWQFG